MWSFDVVQPASPPFSATAPAPRCQAFARPALHWRAAWGLACVLGLSACGTSPTQTPEASAPQVATETSPWTRASQPIGEPAATWQAHRFPGKSLTVFSYQRLDGRDTLLAQADASASLFRQVLRVPPERLGQLQFSWKVPALISDADMTRRDMDDSPVRVLLAFDGDRSKLSTRNAMMSELARALTGEEMPYATIMYVWSNSLPRDTVLPSPRTDRIRKIVLESGPSRLGQWLSYERDIRADYERCYGEPPGALIGIAIMTDTDNTQSQSQAWYGPVTLRSVGSGTAR
ncbi:DUF3047 domain-containing protein [Curvibacter sp. HBC61]|uniref:DUF3047 domain-containing protein n=1 Tax=Curvibacter cyanobacteriorum TaxID=3026422 RepID=A0ABT5MYE4_9BURK|nr:DUF3047 domain-containing protein [Curvibacter sp. HBC61]MDD0839086.1 DUF3047 domain-containing protein [Curvibacter sp. HBC61]